MDLGKVSFKVKHRRGVRWTLLLLCHLRLISSDSAIIAYKWVIARSAFMKWRGKWERLPALDL